MSLQICNDENGLVFPYLPTCKLILFLNLVDLVNLEKLGKHTERIVFLLTVSNHQTYFNNFILIVS